jgi:hypothetical protein
MKQFESQISSVKYGTNWVDEFSSQNCLLSYGCAEFSARHIGTSKVAGRAAKISLIGSTDTKNSSRVDKDPEFLEIY